MVIDSTYSDIRTIQFREEDWIVVDEIGAPSDGDGVEVPAFAPSQVMYSTHRGMQMHQTRSRKHHWIEMQLMLCLQGTRSQHQQRRGVNGNVIFAQQCHTGALRTSALSMVLLPLCFLPGVPGVRTDFVLPKADTSGRAASVGLPQTTIYSPGWQGSRQYYTD